MSVVDKVSRILNAIKKYKKIFKVVEEVVVMAKMLDIDVVGAVRGGVVVDKVTQKELTEVNYELWFTVEKEGKKVTEKIVFIYREGGLYCVQIIVYPLKSCTEFNKDVMLVSLEYFKKNLIQGGKEYVG